MWIFVRFAIAITIFAAFLLPFLPAKRAILWSVALGSALALAIGAFRQWWTSHRLIRLVENASGLVEPRDGELVAVCGAVATAGEPLRSPLLGEPSAAYQYVMQHKVARRQGRSTSFSDVRDYAGYGAVPMSIRGQYFTARLGGFPLLHDFEKHHDAGGSVEAILAADSQRVEAQEKRARDYVRSARFDTLPPDEMLEYIEWWQKDWNGEQRLVKDYRREAGFEPRSFWEQRVTPGQSACAIGVWSDARRALVHDGERELQLYPGTPQQVRDIFASHAGVGLVVALVLGVGSVLVAVYLVR